ncbi:nose resistant to fluoxetine protein 6 [Clonorchis sinensis]|uniref:Nose resistant to fluoxetine protein 6 n=1 Tax=Clonorchis sinensis TaxID=79923 RepID=G7YEI7_CLOSI|nr:nose resistant to fluoxetine protein 6 [Clonorchis sinensis]
MVKEEQPAYALLRERLSFPVCNLKAKTTESVAKLQAVRYSNFDCFLIDFKYLLGSMRRGNAMTYMRESFQNWSFQVMVTATLAVDVFYLMSGLLTFYLAAPRFEAVQEGCLPCIRFWFLHALRRFLRTSYESLLVKPYTHLGTYTMGLLLGWILLQRKQQGMLRRNSRREQLCVGSLLALVFAFCLSGLYGATNTSEPHSLSKFTSVLFTALSRPAFALEVAIVIYLCATDNAPHINGLLSWSGFRLLSQLTYGLFLIHPIYVHLILLRSQTPITLSSATLVLLFLAVSVLSFISSFFLFLVTETPSFGSTNFSVCMDIQFHLVSDGESEGVAVALRRNLPPGPFTDIMFG